MTRSERCRVVVKCRPTFQHEAEALGDGIHIQTPGRVILGKEFDADHVYLPCEGDAVYEDEVQGLVASLYEGFNSTVFAYGASGSGKTHTVLGSKQSPGLVDRITDEVFARYDQRTCTVSVSVEELYCERFTDLLAASAHPPPPSGISSNSGSFSSGSGQHTARSVLGRPRPHSRQAMPARYSWQKVTLGSSSETKALIQQVLRKRHTASTCLNDKSSRSHVIVTITLEQRKAISEHKYAEDDEPPASSASSVVSACAASSSSITGTSVTGGSGIGSSLAGVGAGSSVDLSSLRQQDCSETRSMQEDASSEAGSSGGLDTYLIGKLYLVDLAGSENIKRSGADGTRQKEAGDINKSLCHLKTVIEEIFKGGRVSTYRNSKLTFRLQDALGGGNSKLLVVACISTAKQDLAETKETLRFAEMARAITNTPVVNREPKDELIHRLQQQLAELQDQLKTAWQQGGRAAVEEVLQQLAVVEAAHADLQEELEAKEAKWATAAQESQQQVSSLHNQLSHLRQQLGAEQAASQTLTQQLAAQQAVLQGSQQAGAAAATLLLGVQADVSALQQQCSILQQQVMQQQAAATCANTLCTQQQHVLQGQLSSQASELQLLRQQLQQELGARAAAEARLSQLQQERDAARRAALQLAAEASSSTQQLAMFCKALSQQASAAVQQREAALKQHKVVCTSAMADAQASAEQQQQRQKLQQQLKEAQARTAQLQAQLDRERSEHEALLASERQRHRKELADSMNSSVRKMTADKLRCREHLSLQMQFFKQEAESLSQALASPTPCLADVGSSGPESPGDSSRSPTDSPTGLSDAHDELSPIRSVPTAVRHSLPETPLQLQVTDAALSSNPPPAGLLQDDGSQLQLAGDDTASEAFTSRRSSSNGSIAAASGSSTAAAGTPGRQAGAGSSNSTAGNWPLSYLGKEEVDMVAAAAAFSQLRGGNLSVEHLQHFLEHRMLGGMLHAKTLADGSKKRKHQLVQDMLAYHAWHLASSSGGDGGSVSSRPGSACRNSIATSVRASAAAAPGDSYGASSPVECSSISSSQDSGIMQHPLGLESAPSAAGRSSIVRSSGQLEHVQYDQDPHAAVRCSAASDSSRRAAPDWDSYSQSYSQNHARSVFAVEAADANSTHQQVNVLSPEQQQQQQQQGTPKSGPWSWLTPAKGKRQSILGQLQPGDKAAARQQVGGSSWSPELSGGSSSMPAARRSSAGVQQQQAKQQLSVQLPRCHLGAGCDAVSPRDKRLGAAGTAAAGAAAAAAEAGRLTSGARGRGYVSQPCSPSGGSYGMLHGGFSGHSLHGSASSSITGSAVSEFFVDSPVTKLAPKGGNGSSSRQQDKGSDPMRLSVDLGSAHRSNWRQTQLMRPK